MGELENNKAMASSWWWDSHVSPNHSQWLQSTLSELDQKKIAMLTLIQGDGKSFVKGSDMCNVKTLDLVKIVEDFYISYRSLAEHYDQLKSESIETTQSSSSASSNSMKPHIDIQSADKKGKGSDDNSKLEQPNSSPESVVEDPDTEFSNKAMGGLILIERGDPHLNLNQIQIGNFEELNLETGNEINGSEKENEKWNNFEISSFLEDKTKMGIEVSLLLEENLRQQAELIKRNEEKREVIRDLCLQLERAMEENKGLQQKCTRCYRIIPKQNSSSQMSRLKEMFLGKLWGGDSN